MNIDILFILIRQRFYRGTVWTQELPSYPSNNFAENPRKFPGIFPGNLSWESFLGIRGNSQESFTGKSGENVDSFSQEFLITHSEEPGPRNFL